MEMKDGHLYGSLIDILNNGAPLMIVAVGMTLVIATGGTDLSVGPIIAITGAVATSLIGTQKGVINTPMPLVLLICSGCRHVFWPVERIVGIESWRSPHRCHIDPHGSRPRVWLR